MSRKINLTWLSLGLRRRRWLVMLLMGVIVVIIEAWEHLNVHESLWTMHFSMEVLIYGITLPLLGALLLSWVDRVEVSRDQAELELDQKHEFSRQLENAFTWDDLVKTILHFPRTIFPVKSARLYVQDPEQNKVSFVASDANHGVSADDTRLSLDLGACQSCHFWQGTFATLQKCSQPPASGDTGEWVNYCLPLAYKGYITGVLRLSLLADEQVTSEQLGVLTHFAPEMALALENSRLQNLVQQQSEVVAVDRQRIARELHDTLGQNISYLRLKLDQISYQGSLLSIAEIQKDIESMRDTANEAYMQMRGTLADLHPGAHLELEAAIHAHASMVGDRANFMVEINQQGQPVALPAHTRRQLLYICREALNNVEKHARAQLVKINLDWGERDLTITISDDGRGFDPGATYLKDRYGLNIMSERAADIHGSLSIDSKLGVGTEVSLWLPYSVTQNNFIKS